MSETRIYREAQKEKRKKYEIEHYKLLCELKSILEGIEDLSDEEREKRKMQYNAKIEARLEELQKEMENLEKKNMGKPWDFSVERELEVFVEDHDIVLRNCKEIELDKYIQIKLENTDSPDLYESEEQKKREWQSFYNENTFCCAIIRKIDDEFIGYISIKDSRSNLWEISIELLKEYCNKGYGTKTMKLFLPKVSQIANKNQFQALVEVDNIPSQMLMENIGAELIDIYDYAFNGNEDEARDFEERHLGRITNRMIELAERINVEPRKMLSHVLDYRLFVEEGKIVNKRRRG